MVETQKEILKICMEKGFLLDKEMLDSLSILDEESAKKLIGVLENLKIEERVITKQVFSKNFEKIKNVFIGGKNKTVVEKLFVNLGYSRTEIESDVGKVVEEERGIIKLLSSPVIAPKKIEVQDFVKYFRVRYDAIKNILLQRGLENLTSLRKIEGRKDNYTIIVSILKKRITKNKNLVLEVEDLTGNARVLVNHNKEEVFAKAKDLLLDDIVALKVNGNSEWLFVNEIIFPDIGLAEKRSSNIDEWVVFTSDFHIGSSMFLEKDLMKFIKWLNGQEGTEEQKEIAKKVKYLFLVGDSIDGVGVFPNQDKLLDIKDTNEQYSKLVEFLKLIRKDIKIIIGPGQHDAVWVGVPQPIVKEKYAPELHKMENVTLVTNPCLVEIDGEFKILMYHGASMHFIVDEIEELRTKYGHDSPTQAMKELLKRRHLAPIHGRMDYIPDEKKDPLVVDIIPDIFATGDWHRAEVSAYNNILMIASSCWQRTTPFEEKVGNHPDPGKVPVFNLKTREVKILDFSDEGDVKGEVEEVVEVKR